MRPFLKRLARQAHLLKPSFQRLLTSLLCFIFLDWSFGPDSNSLCKAMGGAEKVEIEWGNHSLSNRVAEAVEAIMGFVKSGGPNGWDDPWS
ncbi:putative fusarinine C esterase SidJ [Helianthus annuus]|nr:putative fusarinine C esterase SidJ [Helianthus annuus]